MMIVHAIATLRGGHSYHLTGQRNPHTNYLELSNMDTTTENYTHRREWLMLCLDHEHPSLPQALHQIQVQPPATNEEFFRCLLREYKDRREPHTFGAIKISPFWRYVKAIHFVRFRTLESQPEMTAQIEEAHSLPSLGAHNWI